MSRAVPFLIPFALALAAIPCAAQGPTPHDTVHVAPPPDTLAGTWRVDDGDPTPIVIRRRAGGYALVREGRWEGIGRLIGRRYEGSFESQRVVGDTTRVAGIHQGRLSGEGRLEVTVIFTRGRHGMRHEVWRRQGAWTPPGSSLARGKRGRAR